ncbi:MAG: hypothetical protein WBA67_15375, partial [Jannaschia sp.]
GSADIIQRAEGLSRVPHDWTSGPRSTFTQRAAAAIGLRPLPDTPPAPAVPGHWDTEARGYATQDGRLFRRAPDGTLTLIRDFTDMTFERLRAPYDWREDGADRKG